MSTAIEALRDLLANMHDSAEDESCLFDDGDGSCMACQCFEHLDALVEEAKAVQDELAAIRYREKGYELCEVHDGEWLPMEKMHLTHDGCWLCDAAWDELVAEAATQEANDA